MLKLKTVMSVALALTMGAGAAMAAPGQATNSVNVRTGPSTGYPVVDTLQPGEAVDIRQCEAGWCYVRHNGPDGWVSARYLAETGYAPVRRAPTIIVTPPLFPPHHPHPHPHPPHPHPIHPPIGPIGPVKPPYPIGPVHPKPLPHPIGPVHVKPLPFPGGMKGGKSASGNACKINPALPMCGKHLHP